MNEKEKKELVVSQGSSPSAVIEHAMANNATIEQLEKLLMLKERFEANEAKKAYHVAMAKFKENPPAVSKDKKNNQYDSMYTTLGNLVNTVNPELSKCGLAASWNIKQNGLIEVICKITHIKGHSESASMSAPKDTSGSKSEIQQIKSTITYLKSVTFESIIGLASTNANVDDDGKAPAVDCISESEQHHIADLIADSGADTVKFCKAFGIEEISQLPKSKLQQARNALVAKQKSKK